MQVVKNIQWLNQLNKTELLFLIESSSIIFPDIVRKSSLYNIFLAPNASRSLSSVMIKSTIPYLFKYASCASA